MSHFFCKKFKKADGRRGRPRVDAKCSYCGRTPNEHKAPPPDPELIEAQPQPAAEAPPAQARPKPLIEQLKSLDEILGETGLPEFSEDW